MRKVLVYIAGPISKGDLAENIRQACEAGARLFLSGIPSIIPHLTCYLGQRRDGDGCIPETLPCETKVADWYEASLVVLGRCDAVLWLPGESKGADMEVEEAYRLGKPVFHYVADVVRWAERYPAA